MENKQFDYKNKKFKTNIKKSDPVSMYQSMQSKWKGSQLIQSGKEGRKLNLSERITM